MNLREILTSVLRTRILPIFTRITLLLNPRYMLSRMTEVFRNLFRKVLDVRPRNKDDYYPMGAWLVSKRLAYAVVLVVALICTIYIISQKDALFPGSQDAHIKTYKYNSILLKSNLVKNNSISFFDKSLLLLLFSSSLSSFSDAVEVVMGGSNILKHNLIFNLLKLKDNKDVRRCLKSIENGVNHFIFFLLSLLLSSNAISVKVLIFPSFSGLIIMHECSPVMLFEFNAIYKGLYPFLFQKLNKLFVNPKEVPK